jgi:Protein of unknown function (DUF1553)/Protein of unknown function (DUF1549)
MPRQPTWAFSSKGKTFLFSFALLCCVTTSGFGQITGSEDEIDWVKARDFWSFRKPVASSVPKVQNRRWPSQALDYFTLARIEKNGFTPAPKADKRTLIRRATFDLTGLPPTPQETTAFLADRRPDAYERLVDRLLGSASFGERMASLWLPLARYAEDQAHQVGDDTQYFYPHAYKYREWVINAFNRDLPYDKFILYQLAADKLPESKPSELAALGFIGLGPKYYNRDRLEVKADEWEDRVDTVTRSFLGLTVACARCHDHKFDPITTRDYYALAGVFASTRLVNKTADGKVIDAKSMEANGADGKKVKKQMPADALHILEDGESTNLNVFIRGNVERKGPVVERGFVRVLAHDQPVRFHEGSGRKELAGAIATRDNPLTARVIVNRVWGWFYGQPIVPTPSNFGHSGQPPVYPELLDWLAIRFMDQGWSMKTLIREIMLSSTYQQSSFGDGRDPSNENLARMNRRRLTVEQWRDGVLYVSGELQPIGGMSLELDSPTNFHRTVYARVSRLKLNDTLMQFDYPDANVHAEKRAVTTTPMQKLFLLNSPFMIERAKSLANRVTAGKDSDKKRVEKAYELLFARPPEKAEVKAALAFLAKPVSKNSEMTRWQEYAQILLASNEMFYVD